ncbi:unnamed protein product [Rotaria sp. Silwood2]|nr:unnamed protein product [Rotaria sp. Silwood2]CAF4428511.1 unnamed protein product [Rotaria sp. Silwood2]
MCVILKLASVPMRILIQIIRTIADVIDGSAENKKFLDSVMNNYGIIQQSVLYNLLNVMINGRDKPFELRIAILYFLRCYLYQNEFGKNMTISTLSYQSEIDTDDRGRLIQSLCAFVLCQCISSYNKIGSYSSDSIKQLICKEINIKSFQEIRKRLSESEFYVKALQNPQ